MEKHLFQLKFTSKQLARLAKKCTKEEAEEKNKLKKAIQQNNIEGTRIYAANAIRKKNEALNYLKLSSRVDAVASRVQTAVTIKTVSGQMAAIVRQMDKAMQNMNLEQISAVMDKFEQQFEDIDVQSAYMEGAMGQSTALSTPADQVDELIQRVAEEHGLEVKMDLPDVVQESKAAVEQKEDNLSQRLAQLRNL